MFPKMQFHDTVERVERLCRSKRMHVALSTWRDMQNPPVAGETEADAEIGNDLDGADGEGHDQTAQHPPTSSPARITLEPGGPSVRQSQAHAEPDEDEEEIWRDMMEAMESQNQAKQKNSEVAPNAPSRKEPEDQFDAYDEEDWAIMDEMVQQLDSGKPSGGNQSTTQEAESSGPNSPGPDHDVSSDAPPDPSGPSEDEDDFYAMYEP
ncbi:hypothetical protein FS749_015820 [Ceratobasidium sp. UAMH 11750]|nr:hypothetical protein FS749_015820 [Ceratobasidium sp. UAMH 11750]